MKLIVPLVLFGLLLYSTPARAEDVSFDPRTSLEICKAPKPSQRDLIMELRWQIHEEDSFDIDDVPSPVTCESFLKRLQQNTEMFLDMSEDPMYAFSDLSLLKSLVNLEKLDTTKVPVTDLSFLKNLVHLKSLTVRYASVRSLEPLRGLTELEELNLVVNQISDISPLKGLKKLKKLSFSRNKVRDISVLQGLGQLKYLEMGSNPIRDFSPLKGRKFKFLRVPKNDVISNQEDYLPWDGY